MMHNKPTNPYQYLNAVDKSDMFFGRTLLLRRIYEAISSRQCLSLLGTRHIGKSSLLKHICLQEVQQQFPYDLKQIIFVFLDLRDYRQKSSDYFFESVTEHIITNCRDLQLSDSSKCGADKFSDILLQIANRNFFPVLLMDAFDHIVHNEQFDLNFFSFLRAKTRWVSYVIASIEPLYDISRQSVRESPFFNIFNEQEIGSLTTSEALALATLPVERTNMPFSSEEVEWILSVAGHHPFFLQRVCHWLFEEKLQSEDDTMAFDVLEEVVYKDLYHHFDILWGDLNEEKRDRLQKEIQKPDTAQKFLPELGGSALFRRFICEKRATYFFEVARDITVDEIEESLANLDNLQWLGESKLRHLKSVSSRFTQTPAPLSAVDIGREIRKFLEEAFESTKGSTPVRQDNAEDWQSYNILYYRYFRRPRKLTHQQIATRLYFSQRTYFRERAKAISVFYHKILEIENSSHTHKV